MFVSPCSTGKVVEVFEKKCSPRIVDFWKSILEVLNQWLQPHPSNCGHDESCFRHRAILGDDDRKSSCPGTCKAQRLFPNNHPIFVFEVLRKTKGKVIVGLDVFPSRIRLQGVLVRLVAATFFVCKENDEQVGHFTAAMCNRDGYWFSYNDVQSDNPITPVDSLLLLPRNYVNHVIYVREDLLT